MIKRERYEVGEWADVVDWGIHLFGYKVKIIKCLPKGYIVATRKGVPRFASVDYLKPKQPARFDISEDALMEVLHGF